MDPCVASTPIQTDLAVKESALVQQNRKTSEELERTRETLDQVREELKQAQEERNSIEVMSCIVSCKSLVASYPVSTASFFLHVGKKWQLFCFFSNMQKKLAVETGYAAKSLDIRTFTCIRISPCASLVPGLYVASLIWPSMASLLCRLRYFLQNTHVGTYIITCIYCTGTVQF